jgi:hypothetical protein
MLRTMDGLDFASRLAEPGSGGGRPRCHYSLTHLRSD